MYQQKQNCSVRSGVGALLIVVCGVTGGCQRGSSPSGPTSFVPVKRSERVAVGAESEAKIKAFCGNCHAFPQPDTFPRDAWPAEIERGFGLYFESRRTDLVAPTILEVVNYYTERAPATLDIADPGPIDTKAADRFTRENGPPGDAVLLPATSNVQFLPRKDERPASIVTCDMRSGDVMQFLIRAIPGQSGVSTQAVPLAKLMNPAHAEMCDLDGDGNDDWVVADLGSLDPADHGDGRVVWLQRDAKTQSFKQQVLAKKLGRVADVRPADFDGDGDLDLVVAEFGWHRTGRIGLLRNQRDEQGKSQFSWETIYEYPGTIHVPTCDLNGDGRVDFVALVSQHQESVIAFLNQGAGKFEQRKLWSANDPSFGSSGMELVDLDQDGDLDVLGTCGDTFDNKHVKPYHGVYWLENQGDLQFTHHVLANSPGAYRALAADIDGDKDLDVIVAGFLPHEPLTAIDMSRQHSLVWLEQTEPGIFQRHGLEAGHFDHATFALGDFDEDGAADLAIGEFPRDARGGHPRFQWWWNRSRKP